MLTCRNDNGDSQTRAPGNCWICWRTANFIPERLLARRLGVSRASVFNALAEVADFGVVLQRIRGRGYRLARPWQRLERDEISRWLGKDAGQFDIEILPQAASSNTLLLQRAGTAVANGGAPSGSVLAVELQTAGRGRMGRTWHSGLGTALTFSLLWRFDCGLNASVRIESGGGRGHCARTGQSWVRRACS